MKNRSQWVPTPEVRALKADRVDEKWLVSTLSCGSSTCPDCAKASSSLHSSYIRHLQDFPEQGWEVVLRVRMQRWRCRNQACERQMFGSRLSQTAAVAARLTHRVGDLTRLLGHATGDRPVERLMARLAMTMSDDTILRRLKRMAPVMRAAVRVVSIYDWAWVRGRIYETLIVDLCLVPESRDAILTWMEEEVLWQAVFTAQPGQRREFEPNSKRRKKRQASSQGATG